MNIYACSGISDIKKFVLVSALVASVVFAVGCSDDGDDNPGSSGNQDQNQNNNNQNTSGGDGSDGVGKIATVNIGGKTWMKKNLNVETSDSWCYDNDPANCVKYGRLYTWAAAMEACPESDGWHLPTDAEWTTLETAVGGSSYAGTKLKSVTSWYDGDSYYKPGTDDYGFSALPGGYRNYDGNVYDAGNSGYWWSATEFDASIAWIWHMGYGIESVSRGTYGKYYGFSVRCVRRD